MIMHIVGNRPQFIKLAPISHEIRKRGYKQVIIHTGQHYDENMSDIFFEELGIPKPNENLDIGSGTHAEMTGKGMIKIEKILQKYSPSCVIVYGDTDSTLAGALATVKMNIPIVHIEAGVRTGSLKNPEEVNRIVTDHISDILFCSDKYSLDNLNKEGIGQKAFQVGDVMYDTFLQYKDVQKQEILKKYGIEENKYILLTWHRQENTESKTKMLQIIDFLEKIQYDVVYPMHPRTKAKLSEYELLEKLEDMENVHILPPIGYVEMIRLMTNAHLILTDSGGVSKESFFAGTKCLLMVDLKLWPDLIENHWITKLDFDSQNSIECALRLIATEKEDNSVGDLKFYGTGDSSVKIVDMLEKKYEL